MMIIFHNQNLIGTSPFNWSLKFLCRSWSSFSPSTNESFRQSANVLPNILLAITLFTNPVYPGSGSESFTYYFPSFSQTFDSAHLFVWFFIDCLKPSSLEDLNWSTSGPVDCSSLGSLIFIYLLGMPTMLAAVLLSISDGEILVDVWVLTYLCLGAKSWPLT